MSKNLNFIYNLDSLDFLKEDKSTYGLIIIDPPYNEKKSKGKYQDSWFGRSVHFPWMNEDHGLYIDFLYERIVLGKDRLSEDGYLFFFIGDEELHYCRIMLDKAFGEENYLGTVIWDSSFNQQTSKKIDRNHEYVLIYSKNKEKGLQLSTQSSGDNNFNKKLAEYTKSLLKEDFNKAQKKYNEFFKKVNKEAIVAKKTDKIVLSNIKYLHPKTYIPFSAGDAGDPRDGDKTILKHPITKKDCPLPRNGKGWAYSKEYIDRVSSSENIYTMDDGRVLVLEQHDKSKDIIGILFGKDENSVPNSARQYTDKTDKRVLKTTGHIYKGNKKEGISPETGFETVKPYELIKELILNYPKKDVKVLDFFAGSGTLAVAVDSANKSDGGSRTWTLVEKNKKTIKDVTLEKLDHFNIKDYVSK